MSITLAGSGEGGGYGGVELTLDGNFLPLLESTLVYCDKMSTIPSLGAKEEIKRQQIKFSDSELDLANIETKCTAVFEARHGEETARVVERLGRLRLQSVSILVCKEVKMNHENEL